MKKLTIIINGVGGAGKDTLISLLEQNYRVKNISSITPIKNIASLMGWKGEKTDKARKFLADMKAISVEYNDFPLNYLLEEQNQFLQSNFDILFVHIREPKEIEKFVKKSQGQTYTLLIRPREELMGKTYGNSADDEVEKYSYDFIFNNNKSLEEITPIWINFIKEIVEK